MFFEGIEQATYNKIYSKGYHAGCIIGKEKAEKNYIAALKKIAGKDAERKIKTYYQYNHAKETFCK